MVKYDKKKLQVIVRQYQLADVVVFGSQLNGFARPDSDLDVAVRFNNGLPHDKERGRIYANLYVDLGAVFPNYKLDLVLIDEAPLHFQYKIFTEGQLIFSDDMENSLNFQERIFNLYRDQKYFIDEFFKGALISISK